MSDLHAVDVRLTDLRLDDHPIELCQFQDLGDDLRGNYGLAFLRQHGHDFPVDRREYLRVGHIGAFGLDSAMRLRDLRLKKMRRSPRPLGVARRRLAPLSSTLLIL